MPAPATKSFLNEKFLKELYSAFLQAPPFCNIHMPPVDEMYFFVVDDKTILGAAHKSRKDAYQLQISRTTQTHLETVIETVLHEMVHLHFLYRGFTDHGHDRKFRTLANKVCEVYHLDKKTF